MLLCHLSKTSISSHTARSSQRQSKGGNREERKERTSRRYGERSPSGPETWHRSPAGTREQRPGAALPRCALSRERRDPAGRGKGRGRAGPSGAHPRCRPREEDVCCAPRCHGAQRRRLRPAGWGRPRAGRAPRGREAAAAQPGGGGDEGAEPHRPCAFTPASQPPSARPRRLAEPGGETEGV